MGYWDALNFSPICLGFLRCSSGFFEFFFVANDIRNSFAARLVLPGVWRSPLINRATVDLYALMMVPNRAWFFIYRFNTMIPCMWSGITTKFSKVGSGNRIDNFFHSF